MTVVCVAGLVLSTGHLSAQATQTVQPPAPPLPSVRVDFDTTVNPCQDFYRYVNGGWEDRVQIPASQEGVTSFSEIGNRAEANLVEVLELARKAFPETQDPTLKVLGTYYASCMTDTSADSLAKSAKVSRSTWCRNSIIEDGLQNALSYAYVQMVMPPAIQKRTEAMITNLQTATRKRLQGTSWMSDSTKQLAMIKLEAMRITIGSPNHWIDYSTLTLSPTDFLENQKATSAFIWQRALNAIGSEPDASTWALQPYMINAINNSDKNALELPASMFQPPLFDITADDALNYGASGWVVGHEIMHGYDDDGRRFYTVEDARGDWWTPAEIDAFDKQTHALVGQYSAYRVFDSSYVDGKRTLTENIADLGGVLVAYDALEQTFQDKPRTLVDGMTPEQRFFIAMARLWRAKYTPELRQKQFTMDPHSPPAARVNVALSNVPEFAKAFGCKAGDPMARVGDKRVEIW